MTWTSLHEADRSCEGNYFYRTKDKLFQSLIDCTQIELWALYDFYHHVCRINCWGRHWRRCRCTLSHISAICWICCIFFWFYIFCRRSSGPTSFLSPGSFTRVKRLPYHHSDVSHICALVWIVVEWICEAARKHFSPLHWKSASFNKSITHRNPTQLTAALTHHRFPVAEGNIKVWNPHHTYNDIIFLFYYILPAGLKTIMFCYDYLFISIYFNFISETYHDL